LRSKLFYTTSVKNQRFLTPSPQGEGSTNRAYIILLFDGLGFFDTLKGVSPCGDTPLFF